MDLFNLMARLGLDDKEYEQGLDKAGKSASSFSSKAGVAFKAAGKAILAFVGAVTAVTGAVTGLIIKTINYGDEIDKQSQKLGLSAEAYQKWSIAAEMAGSDAATLQTGIRQLTKFTQDLTDGQGEALLALQDLGIGYEDFMNASPDDQLMMVVEAMQGLETSTKKTELAQQLFGQRAYQELMPLLNQEKGSIDDLFDSYEDLGLIMSEEMSKKSAELNDKMTILTKQFQMLGVQIGVGLYPQVELFVDGMSAILKGNYDEGIDQIGEAIVGLVDKAANALPQVLDTLGTVVLKMLDMILEVIADPKFIQNLLGAIETLLFKIIDMLPSLVDTLFDLMFAIVDAILDMDWSDIILRLFDALIEIITVQLPDFVMKIISLITSGKIFATIGKIGIAIGQAIVNGIISIIESGINGIIDGISKIWTWLGIKGLEHISLPRVSWLAEGGLMDELGTIYVAGEKGAEIVATGAQGTGVANVEQIEQAVFNANERSNRQLAAAVVNGIVQGVGRRGSSVTMPERISVTIDGREFKTAVVDATNSKQSQRGRKTLNEVTGY